MTQIDKLSIRYMDTFTSLKPLVKLEEAGNFELTELPGITSMKGLESLKTVGSFSLSGNDNLVDVSQLAFTSLSGSLLLSNNDAITSYSGLNITSVGRYFTLRRHEVLSDISNFESLESVGRDLTVEDNKGFSNADATSTFSGATVSGRRTIRRNGS